MPGVSDCVPAYLAHGLKNSPLIFSAATETIDDLANQCLLVQTLPPLHPLDEQVKLVVSENPSVPTLPAALVYDNLPKPPVSEAHTISVLNVPSAIDPPLPSTGKPLSYVDISVGNCFGLAQEYSNSYQVRRIFLDAIDDIFCPLDSTDNPFPRHPTSSKKLKKCDCSWGTINLIIR